MDGSAAAELVSTHSRPKAAGKHIKCAFVDSNCFNTQPPEGGWGLEVSDSEGRLVSTHSRPKAAGCPPADAA